MRFRLVVSFILFALGLILDVWVFSEAFRTHGKSTLSLGFALLFLFVSGPLIWVGVFLPFGRAKVGFAVGVILSGVLYIGLTTVLFRNG